MESIWDLKDMWGNWRRKTYKMFKYLVEKIKATENTKLE